MEYRLIDPPTPTLRRWRRLYRENPGASVLRVLEYETLRSISLSGRVLDVGGGQVTPYRTYLPAGIDLESVNIDPKLKPTYLVSVGQGFPIADESFDHVICMNTLEHVYDAKEMLCEVLRVLKPGGAVHVTVPFIFRIHAHPDDYFRGTPSWWRETFARVGFAALELKPLVWGRYTTAAGITGSRGLFPRVSYQIAHFKDWLYATLSRFGPTYSGPRGQRICGVSAGWYMKGLKP